ncbi:MAG: hypothetical protein ABIH69_03720 [bacterium]
MYSQQKIKKSLFQVDMPVDLLLFKEAPFNKRKNVWGSVQYKIFQNGKLVYEK